MTDLGNQDQANWLKWMVGSMGSVIMLLLGVGVADVRNRLGKIDELRDSYKSIATLLGQIEKRLERIETECRERRKECTDRWERMK